MQSERQAFITYIYNNINYYTVIVLIHYYKQGDQNITSQK